LKKSSLNLQAVKFFGKAFSREGISPDPDKVAALKVAGPDKVEALRAGGPPQSTTEIHSFLFIAGAIADFMEGFTQVTALMREVLKDYTRVPKVI